MEYSKIEIYENPKQYKLPNILFIILILISIIISYSYKTYDSLKLTGIYTCEETCIIETTLSYDYISKINNNSIIEYNNKSYKIEDIIYSDPYLNNNIAYQDITIKINLNIKEKIINFKLLYKKQRIIRKIVNLILGEE